MENSYCIPFTLGRISYRILTGKSTWKIQNVYRSHKVGLASEF